MSDSVGLHAFGLPDVEIATPAEPDEAVSTVLYKLAERFFAEGCDVADGSELNLDDLGQWRVTRCRAAFEPPREVLALKSAETPCAEPPSESTSEK